MPPIESTSPRVLFAELLAGALWEARFEPTPMAVAYLIELLNERVQAGAGAAHPDAGAGRLAETLAVALQTPGERLARLREMGDEVLFVSGFFGASLHGTVVGLRHYGDAGRLAYGELSAALAGRVADAVWPQLFEELADRFRDFIDVLADVSERSLGDDPLGDDALCIRYLATGSPRDRLKLARRGHFAPELCGLRRLQ